MGTVPNTGDVVWKKIEPINGEQVGGEVRRDVTENVGSICVTSSKRDYLLRKINELIKIIERTGLIKQKPEFLANLYEFRNINTIIGIVVGFEQAFLQSPMDCLESLLNSYGFVRSDLKDQEFNAILAYFSLIFTFVRAEILQKIK